MTFMAILRNEALIYSPHQLSIQQTVVSTVCGAQSQETTRM